MHTQRLRKIDFLTGKMQWIEKKDFKSTNRLVEAAARYVTAPASVMVDYNMNFIHASHHFTEREDMK